MPNVSDLATEREEELRQDALLVLPRFRGQFSGLHFNPVWSPG